MAVRLTEGKRQRPNGLLQRGQLLGSLACAPAIATSGRNFFQAFCHAST